MLYHKGVKVAENMMMYVDGKYMCTICDSFYSRQSNLKSHIIVSHKELKNLNIADNIKINPDRKVLKQNETNTELESTDVDDDEEWKKYEEKWKKYLKDSTFYEPPSIPKPNEIELGEVVDMKIKINKCHICGNDFDNLEDHLITSHGINETKIDENDFVHEPMDDLENDFKYDPDLLDILESEDLPEGWQEMVDDNGQKFYFDHKTKNTQWEDPRISLMN